MTTGSVEYTQRLVHPQWIYQRLRRRHRRMLAHKVDPQLVYRYQQILAARVKQNFDPQGLFNPQRLYAEF